MEQFSIVVLLTSHTRMKFSVIACKGKGVKVEATLGVDDEEEIHNSHLSILSSSSPPPLLEPVGDM